MKVLFTTLIAVLALSFSAQANEPTTSEKAKNMMEETKTEAKKAGRATKRMAKKAAHRAEEAVCMDGDMKCAAKKAGNRIKEGTDATVDKAKDVKDEMSH
ncbi:MAG: hypothetical protein HUU57_07790 [Bdellovibrio sp.]|nr:hypothetical protein [Bdellovibrio sp.]